ncbi:MAG: hypothetical protein ACRDD8_15115 [Bacteroidales bacterium]
MTKSELVEYIINEITAGGAIAFTPPIKEIERIIDFESKWLYREYRDATQETGYIIPVEIFNTPEFRRNRYIQLPECVESVIRFMEIKGGSVGVGGLGGGFYDPDMRFDKLMASDLYLSPVSSDMITARTIQWSFWDLSKSFILQDISHDFNINTKRIYVSGRTPIKPVYVGAKVQVPAHELYNDTFVIRWFVAKAKLSLGRILSMVNFNLIGGFTINPNIIIEEGKAELEELKTYIKENNPADWMLMFN